MKKEIRVFNQRIVKKGIFDLNKTIKEVKEFLKESKYTTDEKQNISKDTDKGVENLIEIVSEREIDDFYLYKIGIEFFVTKLKKVSINDKKLDKGELEIRIIPKLVLDHKNKFHGWFGDFLFKLYRDYIIKDAIIKVHAAKLYLDGMAAFDLMKHNMDMH
ncbi:hypothetical protein J4409_03100 [Candidatus Woesearchaeota archaeon]|nr:hypothetical protein [Candidatus Woesearchaeota archaeon]